MMLSSALPSAQSTRRRGSVVLRPALQMMDPRTRLLLVVACIVASIMLSDIASAYVWLAGGHATPAQWALHDRYEALDVHHHHGEAESDATGVTSPDAVLGAVAPVWSTHLPSAAADPGSLARDVRGTNAGAHVALATMQSIHTADAARQSSPDSLVLDPPPRHRA